MGLEPPSGLIERRLLADAKQHVAERAALRCMHHAIVGADEVEPASPCERAAASEPEPHVGTVELGGGEPYAIRCGFNEAWQHGLGGFGARRFVSATFPHDQLQALAVVEEIVEAELAMSFEGPAVA